MKTVARKHKVSAAVCAIAVVVFLAGISELFVLRFERGDIYPVYSSLRTDPLGTKALYESYDLCEGVSVERNFAPPSKLENPRATALFYLGVDEDWFSYWEVRELDSFVRGGGRLIVTFLPGAESSRRMKSEKEEQAVKKEDPSKAKKDDTQQKPDDKKEFRRKERGQDVHLASLSGSWGFQFGVQPLADDVMGTTATLDDGASRSLGLPHSISCHSPLFFEKLDPAWQVIYSRDKHAVMVERRLNKGSIILTSLPHLLSNEAMKEERHPALLAWFVEGCKRIVFDEFHQGMLESPGLAHLARKYHLEWLAAGIVLLALLFVWKSMAGFVPPQEEPAWGPIAPAKGKHSTAGLVNLLHRNIPARNLIDVCFEEWKKSFGRGRRVLDPKIKRLEGLLAEHKALPARDRNPIKIYNAFHKILAERK